MTDEKDIISYGEYQKLSDEEKQNYEPNWNSDGESGTATRKGAKLPEVKSTVPVTEVKQTDPSTAQDKLDLINGKFDEKDTDAADAEAKGKTETTDKANQMSDSLKVKTDTTATDKSINQFQEEDADIAVDYASALLDRVKQSKAETDSAFSKNYNILLPNTFINYGRELVRLEKDTEVLAKELGIDIGSPEEIGPRGNFPLRAKRLKKINEELVKAAEERLAAAKTKQQEAQANYTKAGEEAAKRKAESKPVPKAKKVAKSTRNQLTEVTTEEQEAKAETENPLKKAEELEQPRAPADIKKFSNDLNRFVIQAYLNGDFGKKSSPNAIATMGFFILDKIGAALVNASEVARGMSPSAKSQWSDVLDKQTELLGKRITANWFLGLSREEQEALIRSGVISGTTGDTIYQTIDPNAVSRAEQKDVLEISKLSQEQKGVAQGNINALLARKSELQTLITQLKSDQGWEVYTQAMNAVVGTAKGLSSLGVTDGSSSSSNKGFSDTLSANVSTGSVTKAFVSGGVSNSSSWNNSSAKALNKSNSLSQDALALSKFKSGEDYAKATREAKKTANEQLIKRLEGQIEIIDKCIDSWGKDLGL